MSKSTGRSGGQREAIKRERREAKLAKKEARRARKGELPFQSAQLPGWSLPKGRAR